MSNKILRLLKKISNIPTFRPIANLIIKYAYRPYLNKRQRKLFKMYALEALSKFDYSLKEIGIEYTLAFGTMLGALREKGFISHDLDIDTYIWFDSFSSEIISKLEENGFKWISNYSVANDKYGREDAVYYKGVKIDIFYLYSPIDKYPYCCDFVHEEGMSKMERLPRRIEFPISKQRKLVDFENIKLYVPLNAEEICEFRYGPDYMTPNPQWNWISATNNIVEWREMIPLTKLSNNPIIK